MENNRNCLEFINSLTKNKYCIYFGELRYSFNNIFKNKPIIQINRSCYIGTPKTFVKWLNELTINIEEKDIDDEPFNNGDLISLRTYEFMINIYEKLKREFNVRDQLKKYKYSKNKIFNFRNIKISNSFDNSENYKKKKYSPLIVNFEKKRVKNFYEDNYQVGDIIHNYYLYAGCKFNICIIISKNTKKLKIDDFKEIDITEYKTLNFDFEQEDDIETFYYPIIDPYIMYYFPKVIKELKNKFNLIE
jgi:hypothetical protein